MVQRMYYDDELEKGFEEMSLFFFQCHSSISVMVLEIPACIAVSISLYFINIFPLNM
jgi:hypothetical protein